MRGRGRDPVYEFGYVRDPVKMINVYSVGYCDMLGPTMAGVMQDMGIGPARTLNLPGWGHVAAEVFYAGKWHYLDLDVRAVFRRPDGSLASLAEAQRDDSLWEGGNAPLFFPLDDLETTRRIYAATPVQVRHGVNMGGHTMDYVLRQGETFTRWWQPQADRWNHHEAYNKRPFPRDLLEQEPRGPKCKHPSFTIHTRGNGRIVYAPDLTDRSSDFADGAYDCTGACGRDRPGSRARATSCSRSVHPTSSSPRVGDFDTTEDDAGASVVRLDASGVTPAVSVDNGLTWTAPASLDLTPLVAGRYGYLLRLDFAGANAVLRAGDHHLGASSSRVAPLPAQGDQRDARCDRRSLRPGHASRRDSHERQRPGGFLQVPGGAAPRFSTRGARLSRARGPFTARVGAPPGRKIAWFSGGGSFTALQGDAAPRTANAMAWSGDREGPFIEFYRAVRPRGTVPLALQRRCRSEAAGPHRDGLHSLHGGPRRQ